MPEFRSTVWMMLFASAVFGSAASSAQDASASRSVADEMRTDHVWGRFPVGSWKRVRVVTESLDATGRVTETSTTETTTTLGEVKSDCFTVKVEVTVEVAGKLFDAQPKFLSQGFYGQPCDVPVVIARNGSGQVTLNGQEITTELRTVSFKEGDGKHVSLIRYAPDVTPHILHREIKMLDAAGEPTGVSSTVDVVSVDMPFKVLAETKSCWHVKTVQTTPGRTTVTVETHCHDVPGGLVSHSSKSQDAAGRVSERSTLELVDYGIGNGKVEIPQTSRRRIFHRRRDSVR